MDRTPDAATPTQQSAPDVTGTPVRDDLAVLRALETSGTLLAIAQRVAEAGVDLTPERLQDILDEHVREYRVLCGAGGEYIRLPAGARAAANAALAQGQP